MLAILLQFIGSMSYRQYFGYIALSPHGELPNYLTICSFKCRGLVNQIIDCKSI